MSVKGRFLPAGLLGLDSPPTSQCAPDPHIHTPGSSTYNGGVRRDELAEWIERNGSWEFSRSGGPGGQNVNKVSSRAVLRLPLEQLPVDAETLRKARERLGKRVTSGGELLIASSEARSQLANRRNALNRAISLLEYALTPSKRRRPTKPPRAAAERRIASKKLRGRRKQTRKPPAPDLD